MATAATSKLPTPPALLVNGSPAPVNGSAAPVKTEPAEDYYRYTGNGIVPISDTNHDLGKLLRAYCIGEGVNGRFWTNILLGHILTKQRIRKELKKQMFTLSDRQIDDYVEKIHVLSEESPSKAYIKVFALLALLNRVRDIEMFIAQEVNDGVLPIELKYGYVSPLKDPGKRLRCFDEWETYQQEHFVTTQWEIDTPYLQSTKDQPLTEFTMQPLTRRPWRKVSKTSDETLAGAYATVVEVDIHPTAHSYQHLLDGINLDCATFAVKTLHRDTEQLFKKEWEILKQFSGLNHPHLITALSAFRQADRLSFIFPYARSDFERHKELSQPPQGRSGALWIAAQLEGLIGAIDTMHNPRHLHRHLDPTAIKKYCRHSDIKCDNVLCFRKAGTEDEVILVISDFGLSEINSDKSRSNIPNQKVPPVPGYRPPECDIEGGTISRAFDIWTIGCLFLELVTWFLGGPQYVKKFEKKRTTPFINGSKNNIFFSFKNLESGTSNGAKAILVKPEVTAWIHELRRHRNCSPFLHDALNVVEKEMLVVLSTDKKRSSSGDLLKAFVRISGLCKSEDYTRGKPWTERERSVAQEEMARNTTAVRVIPNENARALINTNLVTLPIHQGRTTRSLSTDEYNNLE